MAAKFTLGLGYSVLITPSCESKERNRVSRNIIPRSETKIKHPWSICFPTKASTFCSWAHGSKSRCGSSERQWAGTGQRAHFLQLENCWFYCWAVLVSAPRWSTTLCDPWCLFEMTSDKHPPPHACLPSESLVAWSLRGLEAGGEVTILVTTYWASITCQAWALCTLSLVVKSVTVESRNTGFALAPSH